MEASNHGQYLILMAKLRNNVLRHPAADTFLRKFLLLKSTKNQEFNQPNTKMPNFSTSLAFAPEDEFVELLWENGQIVMQGQSNRARKNCSYLTRASNSTIPSSRKNGDLESKVKDYSSKGPSGLLSLEQEDKIVPWLNYQNDDSLQNPSDFLRELSAASKNNSVLPDIRSNFGQIARGPRESSANGNSILGTQGSHSDKFPGVSSVPCLQQLKNSVSNQKAGVLDFNTGRKTPESAAYQKSNMNMLKKLESPSAKQPQPDNSMGIMNFSHFSRPVALSKAIQQNRGAAALSLPSVDGLRSSNEVVFNGSRSIVGPAVELDGLRNGNGEHKVDLKSSCQTPKVPISADQPESVCHEDILRNNTNNNSTGGLPDQVRSQSSSCAASVALGKQEGDKALVSAVASSVCSGNSVTEHRLKRKVQDAEESACQSEDGEDDSVDVKKATEGSKRSRASEVHNLLERRRRDRINEKMRALQELIPNCNKVDRASMLDEAIEYLKTLQIQVQIMSMASGLCMPPMLLPTGMQQMHMPQMAHFSSMGMAMGMGAGCRLGMSFPAGHPLMPTSAVGGAQFPYSSISGTMDLLGMPRSNLRMFGIPGPGLPMPFPCAPCTPFSGFSMGAVSSSPYMSAPACYASVLNSSLPSSLKDQPPEVKLQPKSKMSNDPLTFNQNYPDCL